MDIIDSLIDKNGAVGGRAALIVAAAHKAGRFAYEARLITEELNGRPAFETSAEDQLRQAEIALQLVLDDIRSARANIAALPVVSVLEAA